MWILIELALPAMAFLQGGMQHPPPPPWPDGRGIVVRRFTTYEGLPQDIVNCLAQTRDGYLWIGTHAGLARFDGRRVDRFDTGTVAELPGNRILSLCEDSAGRLWIGTMSGLTRYEKGGFVDLSRAPDWPSGMIEDIVEAPDGTLWVAADELVQIERDGSTYTHIPLSAAETRPRLRHLYLDDSGTLWISTHHGCFRLKDGVVTRLGGKDSFPENVDSWVSGPVPGYDGAVWFSISGGYGLVSGEQEYFIPYEEELGTRPWIASRFLSPSGDVVIGGSEGIHVMRCVGTPSPDCLSFEPLPYGRTRSAVRAILHDRENSLWLGTDGDGLFQIIFTEVEILPGAGPLASVDAVSGDGRGTLFARSNLRLSLVSEQGLRETELEVGGIASAAAGGVWCSLKGEVRRYSETSVEPLQTISTLSISDEISATSLYEARDGTLWGTFGPKLVRLDARRGPREEPIPYAAESHECFILGETARGALLVSNDSLLYTYDLNEFRTLLGPEDAIRATVRGVLECSAGVFLVSTYGSGLMLLRDGEATDFSIAAGLPDHFLGGMILDGGGNLWVNSNSGVLRIQKEYVQQFLEEPDTRLRCRVLPTGEGNGSYAYRGGDGRLYFPTVTGLAVFHPDTFGGCAVPAAPITIERVLVGGKAVDPTAEIRIGEGTERELEITYGSPNLVTPHLIQFQHRLTGFDVDWIESGTRQLAAYAKVPPGEYEFHVRVRTTLQDWVEAPPLPVHVESRFFESRSFLIGALLLSALCVLGLHRVRLRAVRSRNAVLQNEVRHRERVEQELRTSQEKYRLVAETASDAILTVEPGGRIVYANPAAEDVLGYAPEDLVGEPFEGLLIERGRSVLESSSRAGEEPRVLELAMRHRSGREVPVELSWGKEGPTDAGARFIAVVRDVSTRKREEEERRKLEKALQEAAKMEAIGRLAGGISHDFNNLLTVLLAQTDLLLDDQEKLPDDARARVESIRDTAERAAEVTRQLLAYSRRQVLRPRIVDLGEVVQRMVPMLKHLVREGVELRVATGPKPACALADAGQIEQVVLNLVLNARDALPQGGTITIETGRIAIGEDYARQHPEAQAGTHSYVTVRDDGVGISEEDKPHIFEPFFTTKEVGQGTGLGLASVHGIVRQSGGHLRVESRLGKGTSIQVYLPAVECAPASAEPEPLASNKSCTTTAAAVSPALGEDVQRTVLVCDDFGEVTRSIARILGTRGYKVVEARGPLHALALAKRHKGPIHLLLTDVVMPQMNGKELADRLRAVRPDVRVLYTSGYTAAVIAKQGIADPDIALLPKPFSAKELLEAVRNVLGVGPQGDRTPSRDGAER